ncbi:MAG: glycosyltransferase family 4 protein [Parcubacteria group bacterium]
MRVAFIHSGYSRHLMSGIIRVETEVVRALRERGHVAEIMPWDEDGQGALVSQQYLRIVRPASLVFRKVRDFINAGQYDVVVFAGVGYPETRALPWLKQETEARFVIVQHGWPLYSPTTRLLVGSYMQTVGQVLLCGADAVVAVSNYVKSHLAAYVDPDRIEVIYPGVDTRRFVPAKINGLQRELSKHLQLKGRFVLLANSKLAAHKNIATLLRALVKLPEADLMLVGSGSRTKEQSYNNLAASLGVSQRVRFLGTVPNEQLPRYYQAADLLVHASRSESLGIVILEALACGVPVVAANVGGIPEAVISGFNGLLYEDARDDVALAAAVKSLLADPQQRARFAQNGRQLVTARFDWKFILPRYIALIERVAQSERTVEVA